MKIALEEQMPKKGDCKVKWEPYISCQNILGLDMKMLKGVRYCAECVLLL